MDKRYIEDATVKLLTVTCVLTHEFSLFLDEQINAADT